jgi:hypothetical protein
MAKLSPRQIYALARDAGFTAGQGVTMTAIALAESGGDTAVTHRNTNGSLDVGLWQINSIHGYSESAMKDPFQNAKAAKAIHAKQGYNAWTVFKSGAYNRQLPAALSGVPSSGTSLSSILAGIKTLASVGDDVAGAIPGQLAELTGAKAAMSALELVSRAGTWINDPRNWLRIVYVMIGGALVVGALVMVTKPVWEPGVKMGAKAVDIAL